MIRLRHSTEEGLGTLEHDEAEYGIQCVYAAYEQFLADNNKLIEAVKMTNDEKEFAKLEELSNQLGLEIREFNKQVYRWRHLDVNIELGQSAASVTSNSSRRSNICARADQTRMELKLKQLRERETLLNERHQAERELEEAKLTSALEELALEEANLNRNTESQDKVSVGWEATPIHTGRDDFKSSTRLQNKANIKWEPSPIQEQYTFQQKHPQPLPKFNEVTINSLNPFLTEMDQQRGHTNSFLPMLYEATMNSSNPFHDEMGQRSAFVNSLHETNFHREEPHNDETAVAYKSMAAAVREAFSMPKPETQVFRGDPTEYYKFIC